MSVDNKEISELTASEVEDLIGSQNCVLVDVREDEEFAQFHIAGSHLMPLSRFSPEMIPDHDGQIIVFVCAMGKRSLMAAKAACESGVSPVASLSGGLQVWLQSGYPVESS